jgi:hypothetical protein
MLGGMSSLLNLRLLREFSFFFPSSALPTPPTPHPIFTARNSLSIFSTAPLFLWFLHLLFVQPSPSPTRAFHVYGADDRPTFTNAAGAAARRGKDEIKWQELLQRESPPSSLDMAMLRRSEN